MNIHAPLAQDVKVAQEVLQAIHAAGITDDDPDLLALLEAESDLPKRLERMIRKARYMEADAVTLGGMIVEMRERKNRFEQQAEKLRHIVAWAMAEAGLSKLHAADFTASLTKTKPGVVIPDETLVPDDYCRIKREPNKTAIRDLLDGGRQLDWAYLGNAGHSVSVRTK